jgi:hypothetical protein
MGRREDLLRREAEGWEAVARLLAGLTPNQLERPGLTREGWSVRDLMWHAAYWFDDAAQALEGMRAGTWHGRDPTLEPGWADRVNDEEFERSRAMDLARAREAWLDGRGRMLEAFGALDEVTPEAEEWFDEAGPMHSADHMPDLEAWVVHLRSEA